MTLITFSEFLILTYPFLNDGRRKYEYVQYLCSLLIEDKDDSDSEKDASSTQDVGRSKSTKKKESMFSIPKMKTASLRAIYNGSDPISVENASYIIGHWNPIAFIECIEYIHETSRRKLFEELEKYDIDVSDARDASDHVAEYLFEILVAIVRNEDNNNTGDFATSSIGNEQLRLADINLSLCKYDAATRILHIGDRKIKIASALIPNLLSKDEGRSVYLNALLEVFAECLHKKSISIEELREKSVFLYDILLDNRTNFYSAECIRHTIRDSFIDGTTYFGEYEDEVYEGIIEEYRKSHETGYDRLLSVLSKTADINLDKSKIEKLCLIGLKEKKGICHILVEEGRIKSWVKLF